jgi:hypothetical protein
VVDTRNASVMYATTAAVAANAAQDTGDWGFDPSAFERLLASRAFFNGSFR